MRSTCRARSHASPTISVENEGVAPDFEVEQLPACGHYGLGVVSYSPLARGVLTGKYAAGAVPATDTRAGVNDPRMMETEFRAESLDPLVIESIDVGRAGR